MKPTPDKMQAWEDWLARRSPKERAVARKFPPWETYALRLVGHKGRVISICEVDGDVSLMLFVEERDNPGLGAAYVAVVPEKHLEAVKWN